MKKLIAALLLVLMLGMVACGAARIVHCDKCGKEIKVDSDSNITEDWVVFCDDCDDFVTVE